MADNKKNNDNCNYKCSKLKERFAKNSFSGFNDYEVLEFLLSYIFPHISNKEKARSLINKFGCFSKVLDAPIDDVASIEGIGMQSALSLKAFRNAMSYYFEDLAYHNPYKVNTIKDLFNFMKAVTGDKSNEVLYTIYLNSKKEILHTKVIVEGHVNQLIALSRRIAEYALFYKAALVIIAQNHPGGDCIPLQKDFNLTKEVKKGLALIDVNLMEHIIIADTEYYSFLESDLL